ncbi:hypothetical protein, partial [Methanoculleus chikugoensis]|uniref:LolA family protein n=1 Tax=Methanoculleus chikugoensis TaxID=118126 RepID=UPI000AD55531
PPPADEIAARFVAAEEQAMDFSATVSVAAGSENVTARLFRKDPGVLPARVPRARRPRGNRRRLERHPEMALRPGDADGADGRRAVYECRLLRTALPPRLGGGGVRGGYTETVAESLAEENASYRGGTEIVDGRTAYLLEVAGDSKLFEAPTRYREAVHRLKVRIDAETRLLLGLEMYGNQGGNLILAADYTDPLANTGLPDDLFAFDPPAGVEVRPMPTAAITPPLFLWDIEDARRSGVEMPSSLPGGVRLQGRGGASPPRRLHHTPVHGRQ